MLTTAEVNARLAEELPGLNLRSRLLLLGLHRVLAFLAEAAGPPRAFDGGVQSSWEQLLSGLPRADRSMVCALPWQPHLGELDLQAHFVDRFFLWWWRRRGHFPQQPLSVFLTRDGRGDPRRWLPDRNEFSVRVVASDGATHRFVLDGTHAALTEAERLRALRDAFDGARDTTTAGPDVLVVSTRAPSVWKTHLESPTAWAGLCLDSEMQTAWLSLDHLVLDGFAMLELASEVIGDLGALERASPLRRLNRPGDPRPTLGMEISDELPFPAVAAAVQATMRQCGVGKRDAREPTLLVPVAPHEPSEIPWHSRRIGCALVRLGADKAELERLLERGRRGESVLQIAWPLFFGPAVPRAIREVFRLRLPALGVLRDVMATFHGSALLSKLTVVRQTNVSPVFFGTVAPPPHTGGGVVCCVSALRHSAGRRSLLCLSGSGTFAPESFLRAFAETLADRLRQTT